jgi:hypothetical protein
MNEGVETRAATFECRLERIAWVAFMSMSILAYPST